MIDFLKKDRVLFNQWDSIGDLQFAVMASEGLERKDKLLDVGCGFLRGGKRFINYLNYGCYFGVEKNAEVLNDGKVWLIELGVNLQEKDPSFKVNEDFDLDFGVKFDYVIAQSLFTHLYAAKIKQCCNEVKKVLKPDGTFVATFFIADGPIKKWEGIKPITTTYDGKDPFHYSEGAIKNLLAEAGFTAEILEWDHPRGQTFVRIRRMV
jgi:SAM-dependent methyltransferase